MDNRYEKYRTEQLIETVQKQSERIHDLEIQIAMKEESLEFVLGVLKQVVERLIESKDA
jgi:uncharacterized coiled-coil protein SlyX